MIEFYDISKNERISVLTTSEVAEISIDTFNESEDRWTSRTRLTCNLAKKDEILANLLKGSLYHAEI